MIKTYLIYVLIIFTSEHQKMYNMSQVVVIGSHHHNTLGVIRGLGRKGLRPIVIMTNRSKNPYVLRSKYIAETIELNNSDDVIPYIVRRFSECTEKPVLIACHDRISEILDLNMSNLSKMFHVPGTPDGRLVSLVNKSVMTELAQRVGLNVPYSINSDSSYDIEKLPYPVITKPAASKDGSKRDITICNSSDSLMEFLRERKKRKFQIQQFVEKSFEFQLIGCSIDGGNEIIIPGVSKLIRTGSGSNTGFLEYTILTHDFNETLEKTKAFIRATGYSGLFSVEFLRGLDGIDYFMEMNFRNDGNAICTTNAGANLPFFWVQKCLGTNISQPKIDHTEYVMPEYNELGLWFSGSITTKEFIKDMRLATSYMEYAADDPNPTNGHRDFRIRLLTAAVKRPLYQFAKLIGLR